MTHLGLEDTFRFNDNFRVIAGASWDKDEVKEANNKKPDAFYGSEFEHESSTAFNPMMKVEYDVDDTLGFYAGVAKKTRFASLKERYSYRLGSFIPNPALKPEKTINYEIGANKTFDNQGIKAVLFYSDVKDYIQSKVIDVPNRISKEDNIGKVKHMGYELEYFYAFDSGLSFDANYTSVTNPLYNYCVYHVLTGGRYINDFEGVVTNYTTLSEIPLNINGLGNDLLINEGKQVFDTIIAGVDTTIIDYIGFLYDESNITTQSGSIHMIDRMMKQVLPSRAIVTFEFWEEPQITDYRREIGSYLIEEETLNFIEWEGADLYFTERGDEQTSAWGNDYLDITGDFKISYVIPKIVQGKYMVFLGAERYNSANALVEVYIDGKKVSSLVDLSQGGSANSPFQKIELGTIDFIKYESHKVEVIPLIPGRFLWDYIRFEPI